MADRDRTRRPTLRRLAQSRGLALEPMTAIPPAPFWHVQEAVSPDAELRVWVGTMSPRSTREGLRAALLAMPARKDGKR